MTPPFQRFIAYLDMLLVDHGIFRVFYNNFFELPGGLYRCSNPTPGQIRSYHKRLGIQTIINLRGADTTRRYALEERVCADLGITLVNFKGILSRSAPRKEAIEELRTIFDQVKYPALLHCKSGADRAGFAAALYRIFRLGAPVSSAMRELDWKFGHFRGSKTGILDQFFIDFLAEQSKSGRAFLPWLQEDYDRDELSRKFLSRGWADFLVDRVLHRE